MENIKRIWKGFRATFLTLIVLAIIVMIYLSFGSYSEGFRAGVIYKLSKRGMIFKTYEGEMNTGNYVTADSPSSDNGLSTKIWEFSVMSDQEEVISKIESAILSGKRVKLFYKEKYVVFPWQGDKKYFIYKVEVEGERLIN